MIVQRSIYLAEMVNDVMIYVCWQGTLRHRSLWSLWKKLRRRPAILAEAALWQEKFYWITWKRTLQGSNSYRSAKTTVFAAIRPTITPFSLFFVLASTSTGVAITALPTTHATISSLIPEHTDEPLIPLWGVPAVDLSRTLVLIFEQMNKAS